MAKQKAGKVLDLSCSFQNLSLGDKTARIGVLVDRKELSLSAADKQICGRRLTGRLLAVPAGDNGDQDRLFDDARDLDGIFDVKRFGVSDKEITFGLTFALKDLDVATLAHFAQRSGKLMIDNVADIPEEEKKTRGRPKKADEDEDEAEDHSDADL